MGRAPRRRRNDPSSPVVDLEDVFADDALVERLSTVARHPASLAVPVGAVHAGRRPAVPGRAAPVELVEPIDAYESDPLLDLLGRWRAEIDVAPLPTTPPLPAVVAPVAMGDRRRSLRASLAVGASIAALLLGSATIGSRSAQPGDTLWPLAEVLWTDRLESVRSVESVKEALAEARLALESGRSRDAQLALLRAAVELGQVDEMDGRAVMQADVAELWVAATPSGDADVLTVPGDSWWLAAPPATSSRPPGDGASFAQLAGAVLAAGPPNGPAQPSSPRTMREVIAGQSASLPRPSLPFPADPPGAPGPSAPAAPGTVEPSAPAPGSPSADPVVPAPADPSGSPAEPEPSGPAPGPEPSPTDPPATDPGTPTPPVADPDPADPDPDTPPTIPDEPPPAEETPTVPPATEQSPPAPPPAEDGTGTDGTGTDGSGEGSATPAEGDGSGSDGAEEKADEADEAQGVATPAASSEPNPPVDGEPAP